MDTKEFDQLVAEFKEKKESYEWASDVKASAHKAFEEAKAKMLDALNRTDKSKYHVDNFGTIYKIKREVVKTPKTIEAKTQLRDWIEKNYGKDAADSMFGVNHQTLNSWYNRVVAEREEAGEAVVVIPGLEQPVTQETVGFRTEKEKK